jgi:hypothetical protein
MTAVAAFLLVAVLGAGFGDAPGAKLLGKKPKTALTKAFVGAPTMTAPMKHRLRPMIPTPLNLPRLKMQGAEPSNADLRGMFMDRLTQLGMAAKPPPWMKKWTVTETDEGRTRILDTRISQTFPPAQVPDIDTVQLLQNQYSIDTLALTEFKRKYQNSFDGSIRESFLDRVSVREKASVFHDMHRLVEAIGRQRGNNNSKLGIEMVALVIDPNYFGDCPFLRAADLEGVGQVRSTKALGVFSRTSLLDDLSCSLRLKVWDEGSSLGKTFDECGSQLPEQLNVFAVEGLAETPGENVWKNPAKALLSKIEQYAHMEQRIVVLSKQARISSDGTDLTEYYVGLGFEKVLMDHGGIELVYTGRCPYSLQAELGNIMIGMELSESPRRGNTAD